jgi:hypothetical protein
MFEKFISNLLLKVLKNDEDVKQQICDRVLTNEKFEKKISETSQKIIGEIVNQSLDEFEEKISNEFNKKINVVIEKCQPEISINDVDNLQEQIDSQIDIIQNTIKNNTTQFKKLNELIINFKNLTSQLELMSKVMQKDDLNQATLNVRREFLELNKKTRADVATIISKVKNDISNLDIQVEAFVDTISEKLAGIKK